MLFWEEDNRPIRLERLRDNFRLATNLSELGLDAIESLAVLRLPIDDDTRAVVLGLAVRSFKQFRAIVSVCEHGYGESAEVLTRSLFENLLAERFILKRPKRIVSTSAKLKQARQKLPPVPGRFRATAFRALLYRGFPTLKLRRILRTHSSYPGLRRTARKAWRQSVEESATRFLSAVGPDWAHALTNHPWTYSGLTVELLAEHCGLQRHYVAVYSSQSMIAHANDGMRFVHQTPDGVEAIIIPDESSIAEERLTTQLSFAQIFYHIFLSDIDASFGFRLRDRLETIASRVPFDESA